MCVTTFGPGTAPSSLKLYINEPHLSFQDVNDATPTQEIELTEADLNHAEDDDNQITTIPLKSHKYVNRSTHLLFLNPLTTTQMESLASFKKKKKRACVTFIQYFYYLTLMVVELQVSEGV